MGTRPIRVLVADDSAVFRAAIVGVLRADPAFEVVGTAKNGRQAVDALLAAPTDVAVLDVEMPELDGLGAVRELRAARCPTRVLIFSSVTGRGSRAAVEALTCGAADCLAKPEAVGDHAVSIARLRDELVPRLKALSGRGEARHREPAPPPTAAPRSPRWRAAQVIAVGASTGGPDALVALLSSLPATFTIPIAIVQHIPAGFTRALCERLSTAARRPVAEALHDQVLAPGAVVMAPGDAHLELVGGNGEPLRCRLVRTPPVNSVRPAVDVLFASLARSVASGTVAVVLTGMGRDGAAGAAAVAAAGGYVLAQDEATSVVWGMPGAVTREGSAHVVGPVPRLAGAIAEVGRTRTVPIPVLRGVS